MRSESLFVPATNATNLWRDYEEARKHQRHRKPVGRVCAHADCDTILSIYNSRSLCALHSVPRITPFRARGGGKRKDEQ